MSTGLLLLILSLISGLFLSAAFIVRVWATSASFSLRQREVVSATFDTTSYDLKLDSFRVKLYRIGFDQFTLLNAGSEFGSKFSPPL